MKINIVNSSKNELPSYETIMSAGMDLRANIEDNITLKPLERRLIPTGLKIALEAGLEAQIRPRSGLAYKKGISIVNAPGTIDADYRGEIKVALVNLSKKPFTINRGDRIARLVLAPVCQAHLEVVAELDKTQRDDGGFGHTGIR